MSIGLIAILLFVLFVILFIRFFPGKNLEEIILEKGESPLFDEKKITVAEDPSHGESSLYIRSRVSVTTDRIVISQLPLLSKKYSINMILYFADAHPPEDTGLEGRIKTGILHRNMTELITEGKHQGVQLSPTKFSVFNRDSTVIEIRTTRGKELFKAIHTNVAQSLSL